MIPHVNALMVSVDGELTVAATAVGTVPATATVIGGHALTPYGQLYVVFV